MDFQVSKGDRIAQLLFERIASHPVVAVESLSETIRGAHGFGSSGLNTRSEYADIPSAADADISVGSVTIFDHIKSTVDPI